MTPLERLIIERDCTQLAYRFSYCLDNRDFDGLASTFTEDGFWIRLGTTLSGRSQIVAAYQDRPINLVTRHVVTNVHFLNVGEKEVVAHQQMVGIFANEPATRTPVAYATSNGRFLDCHDKFVLTDEGWRFAHRHFEEIFRPHDWIDPGKTS